MSSQIRFYGVRIKLQLVSFFVHFAFRFLDSVTTRLTRFVDKMGTTVTFFFFFFNR